MHLYTKDLSDITTWLIFIKNSILSSTFTGSWYFTSSIFSAYLVYLLSKKFQTKSIIAITSIFYILCVFTSVYNGILPSQLADFLKTLCFPLNIFNGCFYFSLGNYIAEQESDIIKAFTKKKALFSFVAFYLLFGIELLIAKHFEICGTTDVSLSMVALAFSLFIFCLQTNMNIKNTLLLRKLSIIIYCCQGNVLLVNLWLKKLWKYKLDYPSTLSYFISVLVVIVITALVLYIQKHNWKWTKYLT